MGLFNKYQKKKQILDGVQLTEENIKDVHKYINESEHSAKIVSPIKKGAKPYLKILTLEGEMEAHLSSYVMKGIKGEFWAIREDIFHETYDEIKNEETEMKSKETLHEIEEIGIESLSITNEYAQ